LPFPAALFVWFIALAIPFFGVVNDLLGAFCVTFETFILPPLAFNLYYQGRPDRQAAAFIKPRWVVLVCEMLAACNRVCLLPLIYTTKDSPTGMLQPSSSQGGML
jgi:hypothetical protein